jgi:two-component system, cell cycle sensor histidine kinase and response regulator CckA
VEITLSVVEGQGDVVVLAAIRDVGERIRAAEERSRLEAQLAQSQRIESLGQLAGGVAHDFNNLLAVILNCVAFVAEDLAAEPGDRRATVELANDLEQVRHAAERAAALTRQLLLFSRNEPTAPCLVTLNDAIQEAESLLSRTLGEHIQLELRLADPSPTALVDSGKLGQVLVNLAVNGRDAMPAGGRITIETGAVEVGRSHDDRSSHRDLAPGTYVYVSVTDTGEGMPPEVVARAFEPFFSTKPRERGTGLGLATVYGIVTEAGGAPVIESTVGRGTSVRVYLPSAVGEGLPDKVRERPAPVHGATVLVVEDEPPVLEAARRVLVSGGYRVIAEPSPLGALAQVDQAGVAMPDLLLSDVVMPEMSGPELARRIAEHHPEVPVLFMSGYPGTFLDDANLETTALIRKPFSRDELLYSVAEILSQTCAPDGRQPG